MFLLRKKAQAILHSVCMFGMKFSVSETVFDWPRYHLQWKVRGLNVNSSISYQKLIQSNDLSCYPRSFHTALCSYSTIIYFIFIRNSKKKTWHMKYQRTAEIWKSLFWTTKFRWDSVPGAELAHSFMLLWPNMFLSCVWQHGKLKVKGHLKL